jgi:hypothetical protein
MKPIFIKKFYNYPKKMGFGYEYGLGYPKKMGFGYEYGLGYPKKMGFGYEYGFRVSYSYPTQNLKKFG